jgi:hypothetical protein
MKTIKIDYVDFVPNNFTGIADYQDGYKEWYFKGQLHRENGPAIESIDGTNYWFIEGKPCSSKILSKLISSSFFLGKEKGRYNLEWLKFLTENGIEEFPIISGMKKDKKFKEIFLILENMKINENYKCK